MTLRIRVTLLRALAAMLVVAMAPDVRADVASVNAAFLEHLDQLGPAHALASGAARLAWRETYAKEAPTDFVADSLARIYPEFDAALAAFDRGDLQAATRLFGALRAHPDPFVAANAAYFQARAVLGQGLTEEADELFAGLADADQQALLGRYSPYADRLIVLQAASQARTLQFVEAQMTLARLERDYPEASELSRTAAAQLQLELEAHEQGTLGEVAMYMDYSTERLNVSDYSQRLQAHQQRIIDLLDQLIEEQEQQEQQQGGGGQAQGQPQPGGPGQPGQPLSPAEESETRPTGPAEMDLHAAPRANPGEMWGKMPPAERERVLQSIRERYPSRYREIVEQFYRSMAEQKE